MGRELVHVRQVLFKQGMNLGTGQVVDFDVHGLIGIRPRIFDHDFSKECSALKTRPGSLLLALRLTGGLGRRALWSLSRDARWRGWINLDHAQARQ